MLGFQKESNSIALEEGIRAGLMEDMSLQLVHKSQFYLKKLCWRRQTSIHELNDKQTAATHFFLGVPTWIPDICWIFLSEMVSFFDQEQWFCFIVKISTEKPIKIKCILAMSSCPYTLGNWWIFVDHLRLMWKIYWYTIIDTSSEKRRLGEHWGESGE